MRSLVVAGVCLLSIASAAQAGSVQGGFIAGQVSGNQGSTFNSGSTVWGSGNSTGSSASGTVFSLGGSNRSQVHYESPFGVTTTSNHTAYSSGSTSNGGYFSANNQTFGQSSGNSAFTSTTTTNKTGYQNSGFKIVGAYGFANFEGGNIPTE